jgi:hypothetical protein
VAPAKIEDMPMASVGAPPVRATRVVSSTLRAAASSAAGVIANPRPLTASDADCAVAPTSPAGAFMA